MAKNSTLPSPDKQEFSKQEVIKQPEQITPAAALELEKGEYTEGAPGVKETEVKPTEETQTTTAPAVAAPRPVAPRPIKDKHLIEIENILAEDLADAYSQLSPEKKIIFKQEGEKAAIQIWQMVESAKIQVQKIIGLLRNWLKRIPGINKFFLEQETKLKTDKIIALAKQHGTKRSPTNH